MEDIFEQFKKFIEKNNLIKERERLILGVSGGPDSLCLLHLFYQLSKERRIDFIVAHFNHGLRKESDREEEFVHKIAENLGVRFVSEKKEVKKYYQGDSLEQTARNLRYDFFLKISRRYRIKKLALAHHKDDLVETVLLRILRGSGLLGLRAILPLSKYKNLTIIRPLLFLEKNTILEFLKKNNIGYVVDRSNLEEKFLRNKIRLKLLPYLIKEWPQAKDALFNLASLASWDYEFIYEKAKEALQSAILKETPQVLEIDLDKIKNLPRGLVNNLLRIAIEKIKGNLRRIEFNHIEKIWELINQQSPSLSLDIPALKVTKQGSTLLFRKNIKSN